MRGAAVTATAVLCLALPASAGTLPPEPTTSGDVGTVPLVPTEDGGTTAEEPTPTASPSPTGTPTASPSPSASPTPSPTVSSTPITGGLAALSITVPSSASLGSGPTGGGAISASMGEISVQTRSALVGDVAWTVTVTTSGFTTGAGTPAETIPASAVAYRSGPASAVSGLNASVCTPGQLATAAALGSGAVPAFRCSGLSLLTATSVSWQPVITVTPSADNVAGTYSGTITHSLF